jgi:hypothetical protein
MPQPEYAPPHCTFAWCQWIYNVIEANDDRFFLVEKLISVCLLEFHARLIQL